MPQVISTDPNWGQEISTDPNWGASPTTAPDEDFSRYGPMQQLLREQARPEETRQQAIESAPSIGGLAGGVFGGPIGAGVGGYIGGAIRQGLTGTPENLGQRLMNPAIDAVTQAALTKGGQLAGDAAVRGGRYIASLANPLIISAIKPTVSAMRAGAGRAYGTLAGEANRMANLVKRTGIRTAEQAEQAIQGVESRIQDALQAAGPTPTNAPVRAMRYLGQLGRSAAQQLSPADDLATLAAERGQFVESSPLFRTQVTQVPTQVPSPILNAQGQPQTTTVMQSVSSRVPRTDVTAKEALDRARQTSKFTTKKAWGEQKGMSMESQKTIERAARDAAKATAPPELRAGLQEQSNLLRLKPTLDRMQLRQANRDEFSLPGVVAAAPAIAQGKVPYFGMLAQFMRNNQMGVGLQAHRLGTGLQQHGGPITGQAFEQLLRSGLDPDTVRAAILSALGGQQE